MPAHARATLRISIPLGSTWAKDCTVDQVYKQAREDAVRKIKEALSPLVTIEDVNIQAILVEEK